MAGKTPSREAAHILQELSTMLEGQVPLSRALEVIASQKRTRKGREAVCALLEKVKAGEHLSQAFSAADNFFGPGASAAARAGEASGKLPENLARLSQHLERHQALRRRIQTALVYPCAVLCVSVVAVTLLIGLVLPRLGDLMGSIPGDEPLPLPTRIVLGLADHAGAWWPLLVIAAIAGPITLFLPRQNGNGRFNRASFRIPVLGQVLLCGSLARATGSLGSLIDAGVPLPDALLLSGKSAGNRALEVALESTALRVSRGQPLSAALRLEAPYLPAAFLEMTAVAEETGRLPESMLRLSSSLEEAAAARTATLLALLEPALLAVVALIAGIVIAAVFLPVLQLVERLGQ